MTEWERMTSGRLYDPGKKDIDPRHRQGMELCDRFNRTPLARRRKKARLLDSSRGKAAGYRLCRAPEEYTAGEILRSLEESLAPVACIRDGGVNCARASVCRTVPMWQELDEITNRYLDSVTLRDLMSGERWRKD